MLDPAEKTRLSRIWRSKSPVVLDGMLRNFAGIEAIGNFGNWDLYASPPATAPDVREYVKSCLMSSAVGLHQTWKLPETWREELAAAGVIELKPDISWMRRERWTNLERLAPLEARA